MGLERTIGVKLFKRLLEQIAVELGEYAQGVRGYMSER
jgi:hypothetical protein